MSLNSSRLLTGVLLTLTLFSPFIFSSWADTAVVIPVTPPATSAPIPAPTTTPTPAPTATSTPVPTAKPTPTAKVTSKTKAASKHSNRKPKPHIASVVLARRFVGGEPKDTTTTFKPGDRTIHCVVKFTNVTLIKSLSFVLMAVDAGGVKNYKILDETMPSQILDTAHFKTSLPRDWPIGKYRIDIYLDGKLNQKLIYTVVDKQ